MVCVDGSRSVRLAEPSIATPSVVTAVEDASPGRVAQNPAVLAPELLAAALMPTSMISPASRLLKYAVPSTSIRRGHATFQPTIMAWKDFLNTLLNGALTISLPSFMIADGTACF